MVSKKVLLVSAFLLLANEASAQVALFQVGDPTAATTVLPSGISSTAPAPVPSITTFVSAGTDASQISTTSTGTSIFSDSSTSSTSLSILSGGGVIQSVAAKNGSTSSNVLQQAAGTQTQVQTGTNTSVVSQDASQFAVKVGSTSFTVDNNGIFLGSLAVTQGINNNGLGIQNVGLLNGVTTVSASGLISAGALNVTGQAITNGIDNGSSGIMNVGALSGVTSISASGLVSAGALEVFGMTKTNGILNNGDLSTHSLTTGAAKVSGDLTVAGASKTNGIDNSGKKISGVAAGEISETSTDAINGSQLNSLISNVSNGQELVNANQAQFNAAQVQTNLHQMQINARVQTQIEANRKLASSGVAAATAAGSIPALEAGKRFGIGLGTGSFDGRSAVAVGIAARVNEQLQMKLTVGISNGGKAVVGAGGMYAW